MSVCPSAVRMLQSVFLTLLCIAWIVPCTGPWRTSTRSQVGRDGTDDPPDVFYSTGSTTKDRIRLFCQLRIQVFRFGPGVAVGSGCLVPSLRPGCFVLTRVFGWIRVFRSESPIRVFRSDSGVSVGSGCFVPSLRSGCFILTRVFRLDPGVSFWLGCFGRIRVFWSDPLL